MLGLDDLVGVAEAEGIARPPAVDRAPPFGERRRLSLMRTRPPQPHHVLEHMRAVADDAKIDFDVLVDRRWIDVDVDLLRLRRKGVNAAGDAIVEARADANHQIAIMHRVVRLERTMHAEHAEPLLVGCGVGPQPHQRRGDREPGRANELAQERRGVRPGIDDAAARIEDRLFRRRHHLDRMPNALQIALELRLIGLVLNVLLERVGAGRELHVLRNVDDDRAGATV